MFTCPFTYLYLYNLKLHHLVRDRQNIWSPYCVPGSASRILVYLNIIRRDWLNSEHLLLTVLKSGGSKPKALAGPVVRFLGNTFHYTILTWYKRELSGSLFQEVFNRFRSSGGAPSISRFLNFNAIILGGSFQHIHSGLGTNSLTTFFKCLDLFIYCNTLKKQHSIYQYADLIGQEMD